jgi:hypothetical protein
MKVGFASLCNVDAQSFTSQTQHFCNLRATRLSKYRCFNDDEMFARTWFLPLFFLWICCEYLCLRTKSKVWTCVHNVGRSVTNITLHKVCCYLIKYCLKEKGGTGQWLLLCCEGRKIQKRIYDKKKNAH